jgi:hypothetical protein
LGHSTKARYALQFIYCTNPKYFPIIKQNMLRIAPASLALRVFADGKDYGEKLAQNGRAIPDSAV